MTTLKLWLSSIATVFANFGALLVFAIIYAFLLLASYILISIREATIWQVLVTYALMILIPIGFFTLQAAIVKSDGGERCSKSRELISAGKIRRGERKRTADDVSKTTTRCRNRGCDLLPGEARGLS